MFPSFLPLLFNAKVLAKDIFLLCCISAFCSALWAGSPAPILGSVPWLGPFMAQALGTQGGLSCSASSWVLLRKVAYVL